MRHAETMVRVGLARFVNNVSALLGIPPSEAKTLLIALLGRAA
jgi:hypothetical protein